ncbi:hypothetical protein F2Q69_00057775 [Brassica cretica]|uniref:Uncharacterized protein n=1 Tax=Brassica cretica TaxID=69181 RepID=A0A8S9MX94_BRACR|nr:hypothetical protein F2Q69_00057775 [Brassica cretica]
MTSTNHQLNQSLPRFKPILETTFTKQETILNFTESDLNESIVAKKASEAILLVKNFISAASSPQFVCDFKNAKIGEDD